MAEIFLPVHGFSPLLPGIAALGCGAAAFLHALEGLGGGRGLPAAERMAGTGRLGELPGAGAALRSAGPCA